MSRAGTDLDRPADLPERYVLREVIGTGGMGRVYRAHDTTLGRDVAVKVIEHIAVTGDDTQPRDRFIREARAAARLAHPNIVAVHDANPEAGWLVMDLISGESLREIAARGPSSPVRVRGFAEQVLGALDAAHSSGVIHRDIKPSNIIVDARGKVTLVDFGVARLVDAEVTRTGESLGTPAYMAPEQLRGAKVDARTDLYGLAATLYELVSGERMVAFETPSDAAIASVRLKCDPEYGLGELISRCLRAAPEDRIGSAREALAVLTDSKRPRSRRKTAAVLAGLLALGAGCGAVAWTRMHHEKPAEDPRRLELFALTQSGDHRRAELLLQQYVRAHPNDPDARMMMLLTSWWTHGVFPSNPVEGRDKLRPVHRDMIEGLQLVASRRESQAIAYLEDAEHRYPSSVEIQYALGEARWHGQQIERGVETLEHAFELDSRWLMALHHVIEYHLARGETTQLRPLVEKVRHVNEARGAILECQIAISDRDYAQAARLARAAISAQPPTTELYGCLMQSQILAGDFAGAEATGKEASERAPFDLEDFGNRTMAAELMLYRGQLSQYLSSLPDTADRQRKITLAYWRTPTEFEELVQPAFGTRGQPIVPASQTLLAHMQGRDLQISYQKAFEAELRAYGQGLAAELRGDLREAATELRHAMTAPAKGDIRMLAAHDLARVLVAQGDAAGAKAACDEVIRPHLYMAYRAALLPDCVLWSGDVAQWRALADRWVGEFEQPSVIEIRRRLAE
ncbi:MAG TPA: protein kinase [Kofleriaceae bacterium]|nr:protein kinase [Kofleriaceae bacterium]